MDQLPLILGLTGAGGIVFAIFVVLFSRGIQSRCTVRNIEVTFNIRKIHSNQAINKYEMRVSDMSVRQLEDTIAETLQKTPFPIMTQPEYAHSTHTPHQGSMKELEDFIKDTIIHSSNRPSPLTRSRSGSEDSHHSHHSNHSVKTPIKTVVVV